MIYFQLWVPMLLNIYKHSCQLFKMGLRDKTTPTLTTPLVRWAVLVATISLVLLFFIRSSPQPTCAVWYTANLNHLVAASFSSLALLFSSFSMAILSCLLATTFSSLRLLSNSLSSPRFNLLRVARWCFLCFLFSSLILSLSFLCLQSLKLCLL